MTSDISRSTFDPKKHYVRVVMQQGRVQLDADWNEQQAIYQHRNETEARDVIEPLLDHVAKGAVLAGLAARAREELVPRGEPRERRVDDDREHAVVARRVREIGVLRHGTNHELARREAEALRR